MKKLFRIFIICCLVIIIQSGCSNNSGNNELTTTATENNTEEIKIETFAIETGSVNLRYPQKWQDTVVINQEIEGKVKFSTEDGPLFDILIDSEEGEVLGTVIDSEKNVVLSVLMYDKDLENDNYMIMQEDINVILDCLSEDYEFVAGTIVENNRDEVFVIETKYVNLYYPEKWREKIHIDNDNDKIRFSSNGIDLFTILFDGDEGDLLGLYNDIKINLICNEIEQKNMSDKEYMEYMGMQEDVNVILEHLSKDDNFNINIG